MYRPYKKIYSFLKEVHKRKYDLSFINYRFKWNYFPLLNLVTKYPLHVDIELSSRCNLSCAMCFHSQGKFKKQDMEEDLARLILEEISDKVYSIKLNWRGEPTLYEKLPEIIKYAKGLGIREVQMNTNGILIKSELAKGLVDSGLDRIIYSVDGHLARTYESVRQGAKYDQILNSIFCLLEYKKGCKKPKPFVRVQMCSKPEDYEERDSFKRLWSKYPVDISILDWQDRFAQTEIDLDKFSCFQPWQRLTISSEGNVYPCCADWKEDYNLGNIKNLSLEEIWMGKKVYNIRERIKTKNIEKPCSLCPRF